MGFLNNIISRLGAEVAGEVMDNIIGEKTINSNPSEYIRNDNTTDSFGQVKTRVDVKEYFYDILSSEFSSYTIRRDVSATTYGTSSYNKAPNDFSFGLFRDEKLMAVIMIIPHNKERNYPYLGAKEICNNAGIIYINFFEHMPNEREYVINRIKSFLD